MLERALSPRARRILLIALTLLLIGGLLSSGGVHLALHSDPAHVDDGSACEACWLACPEPPSGDEALSIVLILRELGVSPEWMQCHERAPLRTDSRGPPSA
jgi:hypothetical protein